MRFLRLLYGRSPDVTLLEQAAGSFQGKQNLYISRRNPTVSSLSPGWIDAVQKHPSFSHIQWDAGQVIPVTTLDTLIEQYGEPAFCKIDVEGYEREVLQGISKPLKALSFEYLPLAIETALDCVARLGELGNYEYNWSVGETHGLGAAAWISTAGIVAFLRKLTPRQPQGDIYVRLVEISQV
jgi:FkbM family methyltransferase